MSKIKIFISYCNDDSNKVRSLEKIIKKNDSLIPIIIADDRKASKLLTDKVSVGIMECNYFIPILTSKSIKTQWVNQELGFATALNKSIVPIVETQIINLLKGFIHKQKDLPYQFVGNKKNKISESVVFASTAKVLVNDILVDNGISPKEISLESLFPGKWESLFVLRGQTGNDREIEIKNKNQYFIQGKHVFNIEKVQINLAKQSLSFIKKGILGDPRVAKVELKIIELGRKYEGIEDGVTPITYYKLS